MPAGTTADMRLDAAFCQSPSAFRTISGSWELPRHRRAQDLDFDALLPAGLLDDRLPVAGVVARQRPDIDVQSHERTLRTISPSWQVYAAASRARVRHSP